MAELRAYQPSLRERIMWGIAGKAGDWFGAGRYAQQDIAKKVGGLIDFVPGAGDAVGLDEAYRDFQDGNYGMAAAGLGLTAAGAIPGAGDAVSGAGRKATNYLRELVSEAPSLYRDMNAERALTFMRPGGLNGPFGQQELYWSNVPELARGQHGNTGVRFKMGSDGVYGVEEVKSKPGLEFVAQTSGGREYVTRDGVDFSKVREVAVDPSIMFGGSADDRLFIRQMNHMVEAGEFVAESPDGFSTVYRRVER